MSENTSPECCSKSTSYAWNSITDARLALRDESNEDTLRPPPPSPEQCHEQKDVPTIFATGLYAMPSTSSSNFSVLLRDQPRQRRGWADERLHPHYASPWWTRSSGSRGRVPSAPCTRRIAFSLAAAQPRDRSLSSAPRLDIEWSSGNMCILTNHAIKKKQSGERKLQRYLLSTRSTFWNSFIEKPQHETLITVATVYPLKASNTH